MLVRTVLSMLLPVSLSTTVDLTMVGLACAAHTPKQLSCTADSLCKETLFVTSSARLEPATGVSYSAKLPVRTHLSNEVSSLLVGQKVFEKERSRLPRHLNHLPSPLHLCARPC